MRTLQRRELDFAVATFLFDGRPNVTMAARSEIEARFLTTGMLGEGKFYTVVWTQRGEAKRFISFRRAHNDEERAYHARHG